MTGTVVSLRDMRGIRHIGVRDTEVYLYTLGEGLIGHFGLSGQN